MAFSLPNSPDPTPQSKRRGLIFWIAIGTGGTLALLLCMCVGLVALGSTVKPTPTAVAQLTAPTPSLASIAVIAPEPTSALTEAPTLAPTNEPTTAPTAVPTIAPTDEPTAEPTTEPTATAEPVASGPSPALRAYFSKMSQPMGDLASALRQLGTVMGKPKLADANWKTDLAVQLVLIRTAHEQVKAIDPVPPEAQDLHAAVIDASTDCNAMTYSLADGIDSLSASKLQDAIKLMQSCSTKIQNAQPLLDDLTGN